MINQIQFALTAECLWRDTLHWFDTIDSTNAQAKLFAKAGAPEGTIVLASHQTAGRGRMGRDFFSPARKGLYLSAILRPDCNAEQLMHLTCAAGVAVCNGIQEATGFRPGIKWVNDLIAKEKKLGGILVEVSHGSTAHHPEYAIIGIGINCTHTQEEFPPDLSETAISLASVTQTPDIAKLAACVIEELWLMTGNLLSQKEMIMSTYRKDCITIGRQVILQHADRCRCVHAVDVDRNGRLIVKAENGCTETISSGEVSIRGPEGYV